MGAFGRRTFWDLAAVFYDRLTGLFVGHQYAAIKRWARDRVPAGASVLELGAGTGALTCMLAPGCARYVATDSSAGMVEILRRVPGVEVARHDATVAWPEEAAFDVVVLAHVLHLVPEPESALATAYRALRPGGLLLAPTPCLGETWLSALLSGLARRLGLPLRHRFTSRGLAALLGREGFEVQPYEALPGRLHLALLRARRPPECAREA